MTKQEQLEQKVLDTEAAEAAYMRELKQAEKRAHILEGLLIALDNLDAIIKLIRSSIKSFLT